jgi:putative hemolysin
MRYAELLIVFGMVLINALLAAYEIALASISTVRLQTLVKQQRVGATAALRMKEGIEKSLAVVQLGITLVGLTAGAAGGASAAEDIAPFFRERGWGAWGADVLAMILVVAPLTALTIVAGELIPKLFALRNKEWVCLTLSPPMWFFSLSVWPIVWMLESSAGLVVGWVERFWHPRQHADLRNEAAALMDLRSIASLARASALIGPREENMIVGAARLASRQLREIIVPAEHIHLLSLHDPLAESLAAAQADMHTRFPITDRAITDRLITDRPISNTQGDPQGIVGYVTFKDIVAGLRPQPPLSMASILRHVPTLGPDVTISAALEQLLKERTHIAVVKDEGAVIGMITLEDIVEELIGDIQDEHDLLPVHVIRSGEGWVVGGGATLGRLSELTPLAIGGDDPTMTLSEWLIRRLGKPPRVGDEWRGPEGRFVVRKIRRQRALEVAINAPPTAEPPPRVA